MNEAECLLYDPFQGDESDVRTLADRFLVTRKPHVCNVCWDMIPVKSRVRAKTEINYEDEQVATFYFCIPCCEAMAISNEDDGRSIEHRSGLGMDRARERYQAALAIRVPPNA